MKCRKCGQELDSRANVCAACGAWATGEGRIDLRGVTAVRNGLESKYEFLDHGAAGGEAHVLKVRHKHLDRLEALKVVPSGEIERLRHDARCASALKHPNIVSVYDIDEVDGFACLGMEFLEGGTLSARLGATGSLPEHELVAIALPILDALGAAHRVPIWHMDVKSSNIMFRADSTPVLTDFGIARRPSQSGPGRPAWVYCTPEYASPEQARGLDTIDSRTDIYSFGVVLYEMATGRQPFGGNSPSEILDNVVRYHPPAPRSLNPEVSVELERVILKAMSKEPVERYRSCEEFSIELGALVPRQRAGGAEAVEVAQGWRSRPAEPEYPEQTSEEHGWLRSEESRVEVQSAPIPPQVAGELCVMEDEQPGQSESKATPQQDAVIRSVSAGKSSGGRTSASRTGVMREGSNRTGSGASPSSTSLLLGVALLDAGTRLKRAYAYPVAMPLVLLSLLSVAVGFGPAFVFRAIAVAVSAAYVLMILDELRVLKSVPSRRESRDSESQ